MPLYVAICGAVAVVGLVVVAAAFSGGWMLWDVLVDCEKEESDGSPS